MGKTEDKEKDNQIYFLIVMLWLYFVILIAFVYFLVHTSLRYREVVMQLDAVNISRQ
jgi:hypothetical protein